MRQNEAGLLVLTLLLVFSGFGCGGDASTGPDNTESEVGSFEISYSGDASGTVSGVALFDESSLLADGSTTEIFFALGRVPGAPSDSDTGFDLVRRRPPSQSGTYGLTALGSDPDDIPTEDFGLGIVDESKGLSVVATGGTVTFTEFSPDHIQGRFTATLAGDMTGRQDIEVTATGTFDAPRCDLGVIGEVECE